MTKKILIFLTICVITLFTTTSCELVEDHEFEGSWYLTDISLNGFDGNLDLEYVGKIEGGGVCIESYVGTTDIDNGGGILSVVDFTYIYLTSDPSTNTIDFLLDDGTDDIDFWGTYTGGIVAGNYDGNGFYDLLSGTFTLD